MVSDASESCGFCLRTTHEVTRLLGGATGARICDECVVACGKILADPTIPFPTFEQENDDLLLDRLGPASDLVDGAATGLHSLVGVLRGRGVSWARIGEALGVSRQAAWERFG